MQRARASHAKLARAALVLTALALAALVAVQAPSAQAPVARGSVKRLSAAAVVPVVDSSYPVWEKSIEDLQAAMASGRVTSSVLVTQYLRRIAAYDKSGPGLNTMIRLNPQAKADAAALDQERALRGPRGPLHGIPIVLKDNFDYAGLPTTAGSIGLAGAQSTTDAFVVAQLRAAGAIVIGKTNMMEFALGVYTVSSNGGITHNPYDPARSPGGSSGGSAAAVAASLAAVGLGTDTCGSLRVPASFNALFTLRPTRGITSTRGVVPLCHSMDVTGALARTTRDLAITLDVMVAMDTADPAMRARPGGPLPRFLAALDSTTLRGVRIGVLKEFFGRRGAEQEISDTVNAALARMRAAGAELVNVSIPGLDSLSASGNVVAFEFRGDLAAYLTTHPGTSVRSLGDIVSRGLYLSELKDSYQALLTSPDTSSSAYGTALVQRRLLADTLQAILTNLHLDALAYPTVRTGPVRAGEPQTNPNCEASANSGFPALSMPVGLTAKGMPVGLELMGAPMTDARLLALANAWERLAQPRTAPLFTPPLQLKAAPPPSMVKVVIKADPIVVTTQFTFDAATGALQYSVAVTGMLASELLAVSLSQSPDTTLAGPVVMPLVAPSAVAGSGIVALSLDARAALHDGRLFVTVLTTRQPLGTLKGRVPSPKGPVVNSPVARPLPLPRP